MAVQIGSHTGDDVESGVYIGLSRLELSCLEADSYAAVDARLGEIDSAVVVDRTHQRQIVLVISPFLPRLMPEGEKREHRLRHDFEAGDRCKPGGELFAPANVVADHFSQPLKPVRPEQEP